MPFRSSCRARRQISRQKDVQRACCGYSFKIYSCGRCKPLNFFYEAGDFLYIRLAKRARLDYDLPCFLEPEEFGQALERERQLALVKNLEDDYVLFLVLQFQFVAVLALFLPAQFS